MQPIEGYNEAPAYTGESIQLPAGVYKCIVKQVNVIKDPSNREQMVILFDIAEGEHKGFYEKQFNQRKQSDASAKWGGVYRQFTHDKGLPFFKGIITSIEKSNPGYAWKWDEKTLVGKKFGGIFGREEFLDSNNEKRMATKCVQIRSLDGLSEAKIPEDKLLDDVPEETKTSNEVPDQYGFVRIPDGVEDEGLPFM
jgi:hypothetical protein